MSALPQYIRDICARSRRERYERDVVILGKRKALEIYNANERMLATPIRKRKGTSMTPADVADMKKARDARKSKPGQETLAIKSLRNLRVEDDEDPDDD